MSIGEQLQQARERAGLTVADVEQSTKIRKKYIQAMEKNDFDVLPGDTYIKGFLRNYARLLNLEAEALVQQYELQYRSQPVETLDEASTKSTSAKAKGNKINWRIIAGFGVLIIMATMVYATGQWWPGWSSQQNKAESPTKQITPNNIDLKSSEKNNVITPSEPKQNTDRNQNDPGILPDNNEVQVMLQVTDKECWMLIFVDERHAFEGNVPPGSTKTFHGTESISVKLGDAGAVKVKVNGEDYGFLGDYGQVVTKAFTLANIKEKQSGG